MWLLLKAGLRSLIAVSVPNGDSGLRVKRSTLLPRPTLRSFFPRNQCFLITKVEKVKEASQNPADFLGFFSGVVRWNAWSWKSAILWCDEWNWNENPPEFVSTAASCVLRLRQWVNHVLILPTDRTRRCFVFLHFKVRKRVNSSSSSVVTAKMMFSIALVFPITNCVMLLQWKKKNQLLEKCFFTPYS